MSNRWITWSCSACERHVTILWILEPGWPSGLQHDRMGLCDQCFARHGDDVFVVDDEVRARLDALTAALAERVVARVSSMEGRPKERFLALGLSDLAARSAAEAWAELRGALAAKNKRTQAGAGEHLNRLVMSCLEPSLSLLTEAEAELLRGLGGRTATVQDSAQVPLLVGTPHVPNSLAERGDEPPFDGAHGVFFVLREEVRIVVPSDAGMRIRMSSEDTPTGTSTAPAPVDGALLIAAVAHEEAEAAHGGISGLIAERQATSRDAEALRILDLVRGGRRAGGE